MNKPNTMTEDWKNSCGFSKRLQWITTLTTAYHNLSPSSFLADAQPHATRLENEAYYKATSEAEYNRLCQEVIDELEAQSFHKPPTLHPEAPFGISAESARDGQVAPIKLGAYDACIHHADGLMSTIYRSTHLSDGTLVALKLTTPHMMSPPHNSKREARILRRVASHRYIITLLDAFDLPGGRLVLVFPFMRYNLAEVLARSTLTTNQTRTILRDMFCGLKHIHEIGIIHRDVKPSNIILDSLDGPACITDFGISWAPSDSQSEPANEKIIDVGSTSYRPPEILFGSTNYNTSLDLWAAGCVVAETLDIQHRQLFDAGDLGSELTLIKSIFTTLGTPNAQTWPESARLPDWGKFQFHEYDAKPWENILPGVSSLGRDLVSKLICYESSSRLTAELALQHPFLSQEH